MVVGKLDKLGYGSLPCHEGNTYKEVTTWIEENVNLSPGDMIALKNLYAKYKNDVQKGCSKVVMFKIFKTYFNEKLEKGEMRIVTRSGRQILGVNIK